MTPGVPLPLAAGAGADLAELVMAAWVPFARHAEGCERCAPVVAELRLVPDDPFAPRDACCESGRALYDAWAEAKLDLVERMKERASPWGLAGLPERQAQERAAALLTVSEAGGRDIFEDPDAERREAKIQAVVAGYRRLAASVVDEARGDDRRECSNPECKTGPYGTRARFAVPKHAPNKRFCCDTCRQASREATRPRPTLTDTEED